MALPTYRCLHPSCHRSPLQATPTGLACPSGHVVPYAPGTTVPIFAREAANANEYTQHDAAAVHDNALRWLFATFKTEEHLLRESLVARLHLKPGQTVLVTGAGAGNDLPYLVRALGGTGAIYAQDIAAEMLLASARRHATVGDAATTLAFSVSDAQDLPFGDDAFDAAYHFGGINLFPDIRRGLAEMDRVVKPGGRIVVGDEGIAPWLRNTELGKMLVANIQLYACEPPLDLLPARARNVRLTWELSNTFFVLEFETSREDLPVDIDVPHVGRRGGSIRSRYFGQLEGISPALKQRLYDHADKTGVSRVDLIETLLRSGLPEDER